MKTYCRLLQIFSIFILVLFSTIVSDAQSSDSTAAKGFYAVMYETYAPALIKIRARAEKRITLTWMPFREGVSHYVLERSFDGRRYEETAVLFTGEWGDESEYVYTDKLKQPYSGPLFYRLRVVGLDGTEIYSAASITGNSRL